MRQYSIGGYTRISKAAARRAFNSGETVCFCACNMRPGAPWYPETAADNSDGGSFAAVVGWAEHYNCTCAETGRYLAYYRAEAATV